MPSEKMAEAAIEIAETYVNGNISDTRRRILSAHKPALMSALVIEALSEMGYGKSAATEIRRCLDR